jgi:hypothetical protein
MNFPIPPPIFFTNHPPIFFANLIFMYSFHTHLFYYSSSSTIICPYHGDAMEGQVYSELPIFPR